MEELDRRDRRDSKPEHVKDILARMIPGFQKQREESQSDTEDYQAWARRAAGSLFAENSPTILNTKENATYPYLFWIKRHLKH